MNGVLTLICLIVCSVIVFAVPGFASPWGAEFGIANVFDTGRAVLLCAGLATIAGLIISRHPEGSEFLVRLFVAGLLVRMLLATAIFIFRGQDFGGDVSPTTFGICANSVVRVKDTTGSSSIRIIGHSGGPWGRFISSPHLAYRKKFLAVLIECSCWCGTAPILSVRMEV